MTTLDQIIYARTGISKEQFPEQFAEIRKACEDWADESEKGAPGWQPIETAPKDGIAILVHIPGDRRPVQEAWWALSYEGGPGYWSTPFGPNGRGYIILADSPTHWMPLPPPPESPA